MVTEQQEQEFKNRGDKPCLICGLYYCDCDLSLKNYLNFVVDKLNDYESLRLKENGYTNSAFFNSDGSLTNEYKINLIEKKKYFYINFGNSGAFMVSKESIKGFPINSVFNIKGYGTPNFNKYYGDIFKLNLELLHKLRWDYRR